MIRVLELLLAAPWAVVRFVLGSLMFNPRLGPLRHVATLAVGYVVFALALVYVVAPVRGLVGSWSMGAELHYASERWLATAVYDRGGAFVGTYDPRMDSLQDVNWTDQAIEYEGFIASPDHKSIPVREVPGAYWRCLSWHEDRHVGGLLNPAGIDLAGVLKIPYSSIVRSIRSGRPQLGVGGSTLPMQFARVIFKTPPSHDEGSLGKLRRKLSEWWLAPVIYHTLTRGGDDTPLKQWAANHLWLAQRTGGRPLHGIEMTARIVFGKEASELSVAEQFVLASAVNKPIIVMTGSERLNEVRMDRWRYITEVRARTCAMRLIDDPADQRQVLFELVQMAGGPPDARLKRRLQVALEAHNPSVARRAEANPHIRMTALMPAARYGIREEMKLAYGSGWRDHVRGVTTTLDAGDNLAFHAAIRGVLARLDRQLADRIGSGFTLDPARASSGQRMPDVVVVAADEAGEIVRYYESGETAPYFGSPMARDRASGRYEPANDGRQLASSAKILAAIALANQRRDMLESTYHDPLAPPAARLDTCQRGAGTTPGPRKAVVTFACSFNQPLETRLALLGQAPIRSLVDRFGFNMPPADSTGEGTPPSTAVARGFIGGSPRRVHHMAAVVLGSLIDRGSVAVKPPSMVKSFDFTEQETATRAVAGDEAIVPDSVIHRSGRAMLRGLLSAPLCHRAGRQPEGTLRALAGWCADGRGDIRLHFAKTGTSTAVDPDATVDTWIAGGLQFSNGAAYSYIVLVGTGAARDSWGRRLHASQVAAPVAGMLLEELRAHAGKNPRPALLPQVVPRPVADAGAQAGTGGSLANRKSAGQRLPEWQRRINESN